MIPPLVCWDSTLIKQILIRFITASILVSLHASTAAACGAANSDVGEQISGLIAQFPRLSGIFVPELQPEDIETLLAGKSIVTASGESGRDDGGETMGLLGLQLVDAPRLLAWLTVLGGGGSSAGRVTSVMLTRDHAGAYSRYQHVNLP